MNKVKILYVEDDEDWRIGITRFLENDRDIESVVCVSTMNECYQYIYSNEIDIILLDIMLHDEATAGLDGALYISEYYPSIKLIMLSSLEEQDDIFNEAFLSGAYDYVYKSDFEQLPYIIDTAIRNPVSKYGEKLKNLVLENKKRLLTDGDIVLLQLLLTNMSQSQIANELNVSIAAVKKQVGRLKKRFNWERSSSELAYKCKKWGMLD